jgi:RNA polymerase sigma-70 factor, ECF subfamily
VGETSVLENDKLTESDDLFLIQADFFDVKLRRDVSVLIASFHRYLLQHAKRIWRNGDQRLLDESDMVQLTLIKGIERFNGFRGATTAELASWLRQILIRQILSHRRQLSSLRETAFSDIGLEQLPVAHASIEDREGDNLDDMRQYVRAAILRLPNHYREIVELHHFEKMPFAKIGERKGKSSDSVRKIWKRAMLRLQSQLKLQIDSSCNSSGSA